MIREGPRRRGRSGIHGFSLIDTLAVITLVGIVAGMATPASLRGLAGLRLRGDAQAVVNTVSLARTRATAQFTHARAYVDLSSNTFRLEVFNKTSATCCWVPEGGTTRLATGVSFGYASVASPPPNTQPTIGFAGACTDDGGGTTANTSCIVFNSRGVPISTSTPGGTPTGNGAFYLTDGAGVYATTVSVAPLVRFWWSKAGGAAWQRQ
jgi:type II secretory pathway pseudopilin PulG